MLGGVDLTEEQFSKIDLIWRDAKKKASKHPETKLDIFRQAHAKIVKEVLTPKQREQLKKRGSGGHGSRRSPRVSGDGRQDKDKTGKNPGTSD